VSKAKGSQNEHNAMRILGAAGYHTTRAAGSLGLLSSPSTPRVSGSSRSKSNRDGIVKLRRPLADLANEHQYTQPIRDTDFLRILSAMPSGSITDSA
jgi:hypothetical protein